MMAAAEHSEIMMDSADSLSGAAFLRSVADGVAALPPTGLGLSPACMAFFASVAAAREGGAAAGWDRVFEGQPREPSVKLQRLVPGGLDAAAKSGQYFVGKGDVPPRVDGPGLTISLADRQRTRLVFRQPAATDEPDSLWLHLALTYQPAGQSDQNFAIRVFSGGSHEETMIRFRDGGIVLLQQLWLALPQGDRPFVLSLGICKGVATVWLNGCPRHTVAAPFESISGFVVDLMSLSARRCGARVFAASLQTGGARPAWATQEDEVFLADALRQEALSGSRHDQWRAFQGLARVGSKLPPEIIGPAVAHNAAEEPFMPELAALLAQAAGKVSGASGSAPGVDGTIVTMPGAELPQPVVKIENVSVTLSSNPADHAFWPSGQGPRRQDMKVVNGVSLSAYEGDVIGILGRNGAGKSTLLKTLVGAMPISTGRIEIVGRPVLLRPGAGMQPNLTGRQNILKSGLYMGLAPAEIREMMPEIIAFAELEDHIDRPFKYYSDGMRSRLIFSIATAMPYDILLLDELLSAGDIGFQAKVTERLDRVIQRAKVLFVVQHTFDFIVSRCSKCLVLDKGNPVFFGDPQIAAEVYREKVS